jgi:hypothetical protein
MKWIQGNEYNYNYKADSHIRQKIQRTVERCTASGGRFYKVDLKNIASAFEAGT